MHMKVQKVVSVILVIFLVTNLFDLGPVLAQEARKLTIAVVDFTNTNKDPELDYLVKGIPESIITYLGKRGKVRIVERTRLDAALKELKLGISGIVDEQTAVKVGKAVGATAIIVGSFIRVAGNIRINARLINVQTGEIITAEQVQGPLDQIFTLMDRTSEAMWAKLVGRPIEVQQIPITPTKREVKAGKPLYKRWWFWGVLLGAVGGGIAYTASSQQKEGKEKEEKKGTLAITVILSFH